MSLKIALSTLSALISPLLGEYMLLYLVVSKEATNVVLLRELDGQQQAIYFNF